MRNACANLSPTYATLTVDVYRRLWLPTASSFGSLWSFRRLDDVDMEAGCRMLLDATCWTLPVGRYLLDACNNLEPTQKTSLVLAYQIIPSRFRSSPRSSPQWPAVARQRSTPFSDIARPFLATCYPFWTRIPPCIRRLTAPFAPAAPPHTLQSQYWRRLFPPQI